MTSSKTAIRIKSEFINVTEARKILGISANKMAALISSGTIPYEQDLLDHRVKLIQRKDVEKLIRRKKEAA